MDTDHARLLDEACRKIGQLRTALIHVTARTHPPSDGCSACELAKYLVDESMNRLKASIPGLP